MVLIESLCLQAIETGGWLSQLIVTTLEGALYGE